MGESYTVVNQVFSENDVAFILSTQHLRSAIYMYADLLHGWRWTVL